MSSYDMNIFQEDWLDNFRKNMFVTFDLAQKLPFSSIRDRRIFRVGRTFRQEYAHVSLLHHTTQVRLNYFLTKFQFDILKHVGIMDHPKMAKFWLIFANYAKNRHRKCPKFGQKMVIWLLKDVLESQLKTGIIRIFRIFLIV